MYELGVAQTLNKRIAIMIQDGQNIPFGITDVRTLVYKLTPRGAVIAMKDLSELVQILESKPSYSPILDIEDLDKLKDTKLDKNKDRTSASVTPDKSISIVQDMSIRLSKLEERIFALVKRQEESVKYSRRIFIVHGRDVGIKHELARLLERLDFTPVILHEQPDRGQTIFSKLNIEMSDVGFAFIILTPDDVGALSSETTELKKRARQNVIFEHGLFVGRLSPSRVCAIRKGNVEIPSDLAGIVYKTIAESANLDSIAYEIIKELKAADYKVDANRL